MNAQEKRRIALQQELDSKMEELIGVLKDVNIHNCVAMKKIITLGKEAKLLNTRLRQYERKHKVAS